MNSLYFPLDVKYIYILMLKFSDSFISESFSASISDIFKEIDMKTFLKSRDNNIYFVITILHSISTTLAFF